MFQTEDGRLFSSEDAAKSAEEAALLGMPLLRSLEERFKRAEAVKDDARTKAHGLLLWLRENRHGIVAIIAKDGAKVTP